MKFNFFNKIENKKEEPIHPDFLVKDGFWKWNYTDFGKYIKEKRSDLKFYDQMGIIKMAFPFDNPSALNDCPFMCKIGENINSYKETKWFGIAYAYKDEGEKLKDFGKRFIKYNLITELDDMAEIRERTKISKIKNAI